MISPAAKTGRVAGSGKNRWKGDDKGSADMAHGRSPRLKTRSSKNDSPLTIAFLTRSFTSDLINYSIWSGVFDAAKAAGVNLICLPGNPPRSRLGFEYQANVLYDLVDRETMDGLVVWGGAMVGVSSPEDTRAFFRRFAGFPMVNISLELDGIPCLMIDNYGGMLEACTHLIEHHRCRHVAFLGGPEDHPEARERFRAYREALRRGGLDFDPRLTVSGDFIREHGGLGVRRLMDERHCEFDAVAAANDLLALGAAEELTQRGIRIPDDVKIIGFDDIEESRCFPVPLTTVRQPFYELGTSAVADLLRSIRGEPHAARTLLPTTLVTRQSCGCPRLPAAALDAAAPPSVAGESPPEREAFARRVSAPLVKEAGLDGETARRLTEALHDELWGRRPGCFLTVLDGELLRVTALGAIRKFHQALSLLRAYSLPFLLAEPGRLVEAENMMQRARLLICEYLEKARAYEIFQKAAQTDRLGRINRILISTYNFNDFTKIFAREFPQFDIPCYYLCVYEEPSVSLQYARLLLACTDRKIIDLPPEGIRFPTKSIVPPGFLPASRQRALIVEPLYFHGEPLGFIVFEDDRKAGMFYEELRSHLSVALKGTLLFQEKEKLLAEREEQARYLLQTSAGLARSNAELEQFTYIVSHDLKEPLRKAAVFAERLRSRLQSSEDSQTREFSERVIAAANRMNRLIDDLLAYCRLSKNKEPFRKIDLNACLRAVLQDLEVRIEQERASLELGALPVIEAEPHQIEQLLLNLMTNALKFHPPGRPVSVKVSSRLLTLEGRDFCELEVRDNGIGISREHFEDIFGIFQRLHGKMEFEGTGIGLAICKRIVEEHHGSIRVESVEGEGSVFIVTLPVNH
jgi:DNA-binding LacI/PurR family transcriptional regulator/signal transduction histidine kinase